MKTVSNSRQGGLMAAPAAGTISTNENRTVLQLFAEQVKRRPEHTAVVCGNRTLTYAELGKRSDQLAWYLQQRCRLLPDDKIGVMMDRSENLLIALLAVIKAGAAYVPMPPLYPAKRLEFIAVNSGAKAIITEAAFKDQLQEETVQQIPKLVWEHMSFTACAATGDWPTAGPQQLMYVMYTSGSTGTPKGVAIEHAPVVNILDHFRHELSIDEQDRVLAMTTYAFDISVLELFLPLICGATVVMATQQEQLNAELLANLINNQRITLAQGTPTTWQMLLEQDHWGADGKLKILCGGEYLGKELGLKMLARGLKLWNAYGPTEATIWATIKTVKEETDLNSIGQAIRNLEVLFLDERLKEVPVGEPGEICIAGTGLAREYLHLPELTKEKFIAHPHKPGQRLYRTGDLGRLLPDGEIAYIGRIDNQVKIRGFRIELGEIEAALLKQPGVQQAVVTVLQEGNLYDKKLVAYLVHEQGHAGNGAGQTIQALRNALKESLPPYMLPAGYMFLDSMPVNENGKINRKALPEWKGETQVPAEEDEMPANEHEQIIKAIWLDVLGTKALRMTDNFFELGGHSVLLTVMNKRLPDKYREKVTLQDLFQYATIRGLATVIQERLEGANENADERLAVLQRMLEDAQLLPDIHIYDSMPRGNQANPSAVFLTGVTGFVGAHLLEELLRRTRATVYCLIRASNAEVAWKRLKQVFAQFLIDTSILSEDRVKLLPGDLAKPQFGLSPELYDLVAKQTDLIYHSGSSVSYIQPYSMIREPNIQGIHEIIRLACQHKLKCIAYVSSTAVFSWGHYFTRKPWMREDDDLHQNLEAVSRGSNYVKSKWVTEQILANAASKGVPVLTFRSGFILCHSKTGATSMDQWYARMVRTCMQLSAYPLLVGSKDALISVDYLCKAMVHISSKPDAVGRNFHLSPDPEHDISTIDFLERINQHFGTGMKATPFRHWRDQWQHDEQSDLYPLLILYKGDLYDGMSLMELYQNSYFFDRSNTRAFLADSDIQPDYIDKDLLDRYLRFIKVLN
jgi:amino acid adenylation domain-containing protein/thioester reductase-like protein